jgi:hypothetical protein
MKYIDFKSEEITPGHNYVLKICHKGQQIFSYSTRINSEKFDVKAGNMVISNVNPDFNNFEYEVFCIERQSLIAKGILQLKEEKEPEHEKV